MRKVAVFVNPRLFGKPRRRSALADVAAVLRKAGLQVTVTELGAMHEAAGLARQAIAGGCDTVVSCGGDGTVFALLQALAGSGIPLGIIPMGTGNVLAQNMRLPRQPAAAAMALLRSTPREIPLGRVTSKPGTEQRESSWFFAMSAGMGAHAKLMDSAERWGKHFSGRAAYYFAGLELLARHDIECFEVEFTTTAGETFTRPASEALVVRVAELNRWRPGGDLERPLLRLATVDARSRWELARAIVGALMSSDRRLHEQAVQYHDVTHVICRPIVGRSYRTAPLLQADGEVVGSSNGTITLAAETLSLLWPGPSV
jgi:diacylglycerol kinase (ATP)